VNTSSSNRFLDSKQLFGESFLGMSAASTAEPTFSNFRLYRLPVTGDPNPWIANLIQRRGGDYQRQPAPADWSNRYTIKIYSRHSHPTHPVAAALEQKLGTQNQLQSGTLSLVFFLWRQHTATGCELFAMTTGIGCHLVKSSADFSFPRRVARRLMEPVLLTLDSKPLVGAELATDVAFRTGQELDMRGQELNNFWHLVRNFGGCFREPSSFAEIWNEDRPLKRGRADEAGNDLADRVAAEVRGASLVLQQSMTMLKLQELLQLFGKIGRGEPTAWEGGQDEDEMAFAGLDYIAPVSDADLRAELSKALFREVWRSFRGEGSNPGLTVAPAHHRAYYRASTFRFERKDEAERIFTYPPSYDEVVRYLQQTIPDEGDEAKFVTRLKEVKVHFVGKCLHLTTLLQGEVPHNGQLYFRVDSMWMEVKGEQLAILQRSFHELIRAHVLPATHLPKPWILDPSWVGFSEGEVHDFASVKDAKFRFVAEDGTVQVPYVTRCLLDDARHHRAKIKKGLDGINALLASHTKVTKADLLRVFANDDAVAKEVLRLLKMERPVLEVEERQVRQPIFDDKGNITYPDFARLRWSSAVNPKHLRDISKGLYEQVPKLRGGTANVCRIDNKSALEALLKGGMRTEKRYVAHGPHPAVAPQHERYRHVVEEEGYDRFYLDEPDYLVFDQVLGSKAEKVELFDLLYWGEEGELYLYHVKSRFGQQTGAACSQIRTAAQRLRSALMSNDLDILRSICRKAMEPGDDPSPFRRALRDKMATIPGTGPVEERFLALFKERAITFVYAFVDGAAEERLLSHDPNPGRLFTDAELAGHLQALQKEGFLDSHGRVTAKFLNCKKSEFVETYSEALYTLLSSACSQFNSVYAKVDLAEIAKQMRAQKFGFGISQISRHSAPTSSPDSEIQSPSGSPMAVGVKGCADSGLELIWAAGHPEVTMELLEGQPPGQDMAQLMAALIDGAQLPCARYRVGGPSIQDAVGPRQLERQPLLAFAIKPAEGGINCEGTIGVGDRKYDRVGVIVNEDSRHAAVLDEPYDPRSVVFALYKEIVWLGTTHPHGEE
jgi:uncharacterized protein (TIGR04141 family)